MLAVSQLACPNCTKSFKLSKPQMVGKRTRCPQCGCPFTVSAGDLGASPLPAQSSVKSVTSRSAPDAAIQAPRPQPIASALATEVAAAPKRGLLLAGIVGGVVLLLGGATGLAVYFANRDENKSQAAASEPKKSDKSLDGKSGAADGDSTPRPSTPPTQPVSAESVQTHTELPPEEQAKVNKAIEKGVDFLKINQSQTGSWGGAGHALGMASLPALTLLECGVPANDPFVQKSAAFVRNHAAKNTSTYEIALAILFLDRLGDPKDEALIRTLGLRLVAGQSETGGWSYACQSVDFKYEPNLLFVLEQTRPRNPLEMFVTGNTGKANLELIGLDPKVKLSPEFDGMNSKLDPDAPFRGIIEGVSKLKPGETGPLGASAEEKKKIAAARKALNDLPKNLQQIPSLQPPSTLKEMPKQDRFDATKGGMPDNSNTQFAILGVLAASRHGVPTDRAMGLIVQRFRTSQNSDGNFGYHYSRGRNAPGFPAMTGAGLLGLAVTHGLTAGMKMEGMAAKGVQDKNIQQALTALSKNIERPLGAGVGGKGKGRSQINLYFLWTVERVGVLYGLPKINDKDWYLWGVELLLDAQKEKGAWSAGGYPGSTPIIDTSFALLFLKRANLAKDLTTKIQSKLELIVEDK